MTEAEADQKRREIAARHRIAYKVRDQPAPLPKPKPHPELEVSWEHWLRSVGPRTFTKDFGFFHAELWEWYWSLTQKIRADEPLTDDELVFFAIWARGFGKSSNAEWCAIAEGALVGVGYVLYVCGTITQAEGHVASIRSRLESEQVSKYYPTLSNPKIGEHGNQHGWGKEFLKTDSGWSIRPVGLDQNIRGVKEGDLRPTLIILDDIDDVNDSPYVVEQKIKKITGSILPTGSAYTRKIFAQNLIHKNSVLNLALTRKRDLLQRRIAKGPYPAFKDLKIEVISTPDGPINHIKRGSPTWPGIDMREVQRFLDDSGKDLFLAEYQHDFSAIQQRLVISEYDETVHIITWSQFQKVFGARHIPQHWHRGVGHDIGYTKEHLSSWSFIATSALNSRLPNMRFLYRGINFCEPLLDDMAKDIQQILKPDPASGRLFDEKESIKQWKMSHEKKGERMTYTAKYKFPFSTCDFGKSDGISQWRHYLTPDKRQTHPFNDDIWVPAEVTVDGKDVDAHWLLGRPSFYYIVDDDQVTKPEDDRGLQIHRQQVSGWEYRPSTESDSGLSKEQPTKAREDSCDSVRMVTSLWGPIAAPYTRREYQESLLPEEVRLETIGTQLQAGPVENFNELWLQRLDAIQEVKIKQKQPRRGSVYDQIRNGR